MKNKELLEKYGIFTFEYVNDEFNKLKEQFIEMAQLKSDFDIEKFTVKREGNFIAHNFHFLMRQYSLTLGELRRMLIEKEEKERKIIELKALIKKGEKKLLVYIGNGIQEKYVDLYKKQLINELDILDIDITNKAMRIIKFEQCRKKLIELNGGDITNEQYQKEEPLYWKWFLSRKALWQRSQTLTGIHEGVWENFHYLEEKSLINPEFQIEMSKKTDKNGKIFLDLDKMMEEVELRKKLDSNHMNVELLEE